MNENDEVSDTTRQLKTVQQLPPGLMLLKMENESIMSMAQVHPRDPMKIVAQLKSLIEAYPAAADEAIYSKPVGTVQQVTCGSPKCGIKYEVAKIDRDTVCPNCNCRDRKEVRAVKKFAEGLSIRAAESIRSIFGYTRLATTTDILPDGNAKLSGVLVDYAAGNMTSDERIVSRRYKARDGGMVETPEDRFLGVVVKAEKAKLRRDVILDSTPGIVKAMFRDMCEEKLKALVSPELIEQKIIPAFAAHHISKEDLDKIVGKPLALGWDEETRLMLRKILTALNAEETSRADLMRDIGGIASTGRPDSQDTYTQVGPEDDGNQDPEAKPAGKTLGDVGAKAKAAAATKAPEPKKEPIPEVKGTSTGGTPTVLQGEVIAAPSVPAGPPLVPDVLVPLSNDLAIAKTIDQLGAVWDQHMMPEGRPVHEEAIMDEGQKIFEFHERRILTAVANAAAATAVPVSPEAEQYIARFRNSKTKAGVERIIADGHSQVDGKWKFPSAADRAAIAAAGAARLAEVAAKA